VQLHFDADRDLPAKLRERLALELRILQVVHFDAKTAEENANQLARHARNPNIDAVLVDSRTGSAVGGTGVAFDWAAARKSLFRKAKDLKLIAAGGLNPKNVAEAIATLRPWGVDAVSGVEAAPGRKDPDKVRAFVANARAAAKEKVAPR
jgi:phosphoribosylanthranilate isomerase